MPTASRAGQRRKSHTPSETVISTRRARALRSACCGEQTALLTQTARVNIPPRRIPARTPSPWVAGVLRTRYRSRRSLNPGRNNVACEIRPDPKRRCLKRAVSYPRSVDIMLESYQAFKRVLQKNPHPIDPDVCRGRIPRPADPRVERWARASRPSATADRSSPSALSGSRQFQYRLRSRDTPREPSAPGEKSPRRRLPARAENLSDE